MLKPVIRIALAVAVPAVAALALSPSGAGANVRKSIAAGAICQFDGEDGPARHSALIGLVMPAGAEVPEGDLDTVTFNAECSITRDLPLSTTGFSDIEVRLRGYRNTEPRDVTCQVFSARADGTFLDSASLTVTVPPFDPSTGQPLTVMDFGSAIGVTGSKLYAGVHCFLPYDVALTSVYSSENDGVSGN